MILPGNRYITVCLVFLSTDARQFVSIKHAIGSCSPPYSSRSGHTGLGRCQCNVPCYVMWWLRLLYQRSASVQNNTRLVLLCEFKILKVFHRQCELRGGKTFTLILRVPPPTHTPLTLPTYTHTQNIW